MIGTPEERFWDKVNMGGSIDYPYCREWNAFRNKQGYGQFRFQDRMQKAHRVSWILNKGEIPEELCVLHHCDNPPCVNPDHLWLGTDADNVADRDEKGRGKSHNSNKTHCDKGHPLSGDNLYIVPTTGARQCRTCAAERREANKEKITGQQAAYRKAHKKEITERTAAYYRANKEKKAEYGVAYREANKEKIAALHAAYYQAKKRELLING